MGAYKRGLKPQNFGEHRQKSFLENRAFSGLIGAFSGRIGAFLGPTGTRSSEGEEQNLPRKGLFGLTGACGPSPRLDFL